MNVIAQILKQRTTGRTTCVTVPVKESGSGTAIADRVVQAQGFRGLGENWTEVSASDALVIAASLLHRDLAHRSDIMPFAVASELVMQLFDMAPEPHSYFTNGDWELAPDDDSAPATLTGWDPISDSAFDSGIVCVRDGIAALLWVQDEE